jgi:hypothetical protein
MARKRLQRPRKSDRTGSHFISHYVKIRSLLLIPALAASSFVMLAPAQTPAPNGQAAQKLERLASQLSLTPDQKRQLIPILVAEAPKVRAVKADTSLSRMQKMQQLKAIHDETDPQVKSILTSEQYQKLQEIRRQEIQQAIRNRSNQ